MIRRSTPHPPARRGPVRARARSTPGSSPARPRYGHRCSRPPRRSDRRLWVHRSTWPRSYPVREQGNHGHRASGVLGHPARSRGWSYADLGRDRVAQVYLLAYRFGADLELHAVGVTEEQRPLVTEALDIADLGAGVDHARLDLLEHALRFDRERVVIDRASMTLGPTLADDVVGGDLEDVERRTATEVEDRHSWM